LVTRTVAMFPTIAAMIASVLAVGMLVDVSLLVCETARVDVVDPLYSLVADDV